MNVSEKRVPLHLHNYLPTLELEGICLPHHQKKGKIICLLSKGSV